MKLGDLTHPSAKRAARNGAVALVPVGATEAHGPHLPLDTDVRIAEETCRRAVARLADELNLQALVFPSVAYSVTEYAAPFEGTIGVPREAALAYLRGLLESASRHGFRAICLVNAHLEPTHRRVLREAVRSAEADCPLLIADPCDRRWVPRLTEEFQSGKCHAGQYETSLILAAGGPVDVAALAALPPVDIDLVEGMNAGMSTFAQMGAHDAYFGQPSRASAVEGHRTYGILANIVVEVIAERLAGPHAHAPES